MNRRALVAGALATPIVSLVKPAGSVGGAPGEMDYDEVRGLILDRLPFGLNYSTFEIDDEGRPIPAGVVIVPGGIVIGTAMAHNIRGYEFAYELEPLSPLRFLGDWLNTAKFWRIDNHGFVQFRSEIGGAYGTCVRAYWL